MRAGGVGTDRHPQHEEVAVPNPSIKDEEQYRALRRDGASKEKAARIANASAATSRSSTGRKGGASPAYEDWSREELYDKARQVGIEGRSRMRKGQLIDALRHH
jgi:hypothetical protein